MKPLVKRRTALIVIIGAAIALAAVFTRAFRVFAFASAAGIRSLFAAKIVPSGSFAAAAMRNGNTPRPLAVQNGKGMITYHPAYDRYDRERVTHALQEAASVGATFLRCDINWRDVMPSADEVNSSALEWYAGFFNDVHQVFGFAPQVVLSNPAPAIANLETERRLKLWEKYVSAVVKMLAGNCRHFQLLNELNNPVFQFFPSEASASALQTAADIIRQAVPGARLSINFISDIWPWQLQLQDLLSAAPQAIDVVGVDTYPGTWNIEIDTGNKAFSVLPRMLRAKLPALRSDQAIAISETGYSTNIPFVREEADQLKYFRRLRKSVRELRRLEFVGIYELTDENSDVRLDPEPNFGLLDSRLRRKLAFDEVRKFFGELNA